MSVPTIPLHVYARPHGLVRVVHVGIDSPWGEIGNAMAHLGIEFAAEVLPDPSLGFAVSAEYDDETLAYEFTDTVGTPYIKFVKEAYRNFMR